MLNLKDLKSAHGKAMAGMEAAANALEAAEKAGDAAKVTAVQADFAKFEAECSALQGKCEMAEKLAAQHKQNSRLGDLSAPVTETPAGKSDVQTPTTVAAAPVNRESDEEIHVNHFLDVVCGKTISDAAMDALQPKSKKLSKGVGGIAMPGSLARRMMPELFRLSPQGKASTGPMTSVTPTADQLRPTEFRPQLISFEGEAPAIYPRTNQVPTVSGRAIWPKLTQTLADQFGGVVVNWGAEGADAPQTQPNFTQMQIDTFECVGYTEVSRMLLNRSMIDLTAVLTKLFRASMLNTIDLAIINGDGNGKPKGILNTSGIGQVKRAVDSQVSYADLIKMKYSLPPQLRANAVWVIADTAMQYIEGLLDGQNRPLFVQTLGYATPLGTGAMPGAPSITPTVTGQVSGNLLGFPVIPTRRTVLGSFGDVMFVDPTQYVSANEQEIIVNSSEHFKFQANLVSFLVIAMIGGRVGQELAFAGLDTVAGTTLQ